MKASFLKVYCCLGLIGMFVSTATAEIKVYPNPWVPEDARGNRGDLTATGAIKFKGLPTLDGEIRLYTVTGSMVKRIEFTAAESTADTVTWNGKNDDGEYVASGVYLWVVKSGGTTKTGKVVVIR
jgi:flagellar hook assembly protein FlgD